MAVAVERSTGGPTSDRGVQALERTGRRRGGKPRSPGGVSSAPRRLGVAVHAVAAGGLTMIMTQSSSLRGPTGLDTGVSAPRRRPPVPSGAAWSAAW
jgi:hypothetical protein